MKYSCGNCKYIGPAENGWAGNSCTRIVHINDPRSVNLGIHTYLCGDVNRKDMSTIPTMIVRPDFVCILYEPKE
jgi:hypothetical protein